MRFINIVTDTEFTALAVNVLVTVVPEKIFSVHIRISDIVCVIFQNQNYIIQLEF